MARGRQSSAAEWVKRLHGTAHAKARLETILLMIAGKRTVSEACSQLGIRERRLHALRKHALQAALAALEPRPAGRRARNAHRADTRLDEMKQALGKLRLDLRAAQVREEIALIMPRLLRKRGPSPGKIAKKAHARRGGGARHGD